MIDDPEEAQIREAIAAAREMQKEVHKVAADFPPEGRVLRDKMCAAADRTVLNLELALEAYLKDRPVVH